MVGVPLGRVHWGTRRHFHTCRCSNTHFPGTSRRILLFCRTRGCPQTPASRFCNRDARSCRDACCQQIDSPHSKIRFGRKFCSARACYYLSCLRCTLAGHCRRRRCLGAFLRSASHPMDCTDVAQCAQVSRSGYKFSNAQPDSRSGN